MGDGLTWLDEEEAEEEESLVLVLAPLLLLLLVLLDGCVDDDEEGDMVDRVSSSLRARKARTRYSAVAACRGIVVKGGRRRRDCGMSDNDDDDDDDDDDNDDVDVSTFECNSINARNPALQNW